jgi:hypothetical protein
MSLRSFFKGNALTFHGCLLLATSILGQLRVDRYSRLVLPGGYVVRRRDNASLAAVVPTWCRALGVCRLIPTLFLIFHNHTLQSSSPLRPHHRHLLVALLDPNSSSWTYIPCDTTTGMSYSSLGIHMYPYKNSKQPVTTLKMPVSSFYHHCSHRMCSRTDEIVC